MLVVNKGIAQPWECDVMGHLTTRFYVAMFDDASYHVLYELFGWTISADESKRCGWADVRHVIEYKAEVSAGDVLEVRAHLQKIGTKSFTMLYEMVNLGRDEVAATLESICVYFDLEARAAIAMTDEMKARAQPFLERKERLMNLEQASKLTYAEWQQMASELKKTAETRLFIGGEFVDAIEGGTFDNICPVDGSVINTCAAGTEADINKAVAIAKASFKSGEWSRMAPRERMTVMYRWAELIGENGAELSLMDTIDMGKPISDMVEVDLPSCIETIQYFAESIDKVTGTVTATEYDVMSTVLREPMGVVACISPWNYPLLMGLWKIAPSLAAGNSTILKPAEQSPLSCYRAAELFVEAGGPAGALQVVNGLGEEAGQPLARHMDVAKVSFTGSTEVGKLMHVYSGQSNMKKVSLECGGKGPQVFCEDLEGELLDRAVATAIDGIFFNMGEVCSAGSRLIVHSDIYDEFVAKFIEKGKDAFVCGDPLDPSVNLGPLVDHGSQSRVLGMIEKAKSEGGNVEFGGVAPAGPLENGAYIIPTMITGVNNDDYIAQNEVFGPVVAVIRVDSDDEAIEVANNSMYGLQGSVWTNNYRKAMRFVREIECGTFLVNSFDEGDMTQPFGGYKQSGNAKDKCFESLLAYTNAKAAWFRLN